MQDVALDDIRLFVTRGDTKAWTFEVDWDGVMTSGDLTSLRFTVKAVRGAPDADALMALGIGSGVTVDDATHVTVALPEDAWDAWPSTLRMAEWDIEARTVTQVRTIASGDLVVLGDVRMDAP